MKRLEVTPLFMQKEKVIIVHMYIPFADFSVVWAFLQSYCEGLRGGDKVMNTFGICSGKYTFFGRFQIDLNCVGGVRMPPTVFTFGGEREFYPGQPSYCRKCFVYRHTSNKCDQRAKCRFCEKEGHFSKDCKELRRCDICKEPGHLAKQCDRYFSARRWVALEERVAKRLAKWPLTTAEAQDGGAGG